MRWQFLELTNNDTNDDLTETQVRPVPNLMDGSMGGIQPVSAKRAHIKMPRCASSVHMLLPSYTSQRNSIGLAFESSFSPSLRPISSIHALTAESPTT